MKIDIKTQRTYTLTLDDEDARLMEEIGKYAQETAMKLPAGSTSPELYGMIEQLGSLRGTF